MRHVKWISLLLLVALLLAACAQQPARDASSQRSHATIDYAKFVQKSVPWFHFASLYSWDSNQLGYVVVWTSPVKAYRLALVGPCLGLQTAAGIIGLSSHNGMVDANRDAVLAGGDHCQIMRIEQLDAKAIREARTQAKAEDSKQE